MEELTAGIEEQLVLYTRAKRREGAIPDRAELNPKRQRTGSDSTHPMLVGAASKMCLSSQELVRTCAIHYRSRRISKSQRKLNQSNSHSFVE
jgi:hypothetical protein